MGVSLRAVAVGSRARRVRVRNDGSLGADARQDRRGAGADGAVVHAHLDAGHSVAELTKRFNLSQPGLYKYLTREKARRNDAPTSPADH
nr:hypothetical protein GCM10017611_71970 [Rhodococcus wratislaviensis]